MKRLELTKDGSNLIISIGLLNKNVSSIEVSELKKFLNDDKSTSISMYSDLPSGKCVEKPDCANAELDGSGRCLGYSKVNDDEPIEVCKECSKHTMYEYQDDVETSSLLEVLMSCIDIGGHDSVVVVTMTQFLPKIIPNRHDKSFEETSKIFSRVLSSNKNLVHYYARPKENFSISEGISEALQRGVRYLIVEDLS